MLRLLSYNCRGWNSGSLFLEASVLNKYDICLIQEHWLTPEQLILLDINPSFCSFGVSAIDSSVVINGRPYGGCGFLVRKSLLNLITRLDILSSRFCALSVCFNSFTALILCVYLPTNYGTIHSDNIFRETLAEIRGFLDSCQYDNVVIAGDFNVDFTQSSNPLSYLKSFMLELNLCAVDLASSDISFSYERDDGAVRS